MKISQNSITEIQNTVNSVFGKIAFGSSKKIAKLQNASATEPNSSEEQRILDLLALWVGGGYDTYSANELSKYYQLLTKAKLEFPQIFKPNTPDGSMLYRGIRELSKDLNQKLTNPNVKWEEIKIGNRFFMKNLVPVKYTPRTSIQSWTSNPKVGVSFARSGAIMLTEQNKEFLFNQEFLKTLFKQISPTTATNEFEVIHFGVDYSSKVYICLSEYSHFMLQHSK